MKKIFRVFYGLLVLGCAAVFVGVGYFCAAVPERVAVGQGQSFGVGAWVQSRPLTDDGALPTASAGQQYRARLTLGSFIPLKEVTVTVSETRTVMVCGTPFDQLHLLHPAIHDSV